MLKRSRAPSPSPTRGDPSSPPPLDDNITLPLPKRRRAVGPSIDSSKRRECATEDDGEDDEDFNCEYDDTNAMTTSSDGKVYEHVNHFLHCLHTENQHRSRSAQLQSGSSFTHLHSHITVPSTLMSPRDSWPSCSAPFSSPAKYLQDSQSSSSLMSTRRHEHEMLREVEEAASGCSGTVCGMTQAIPNKSEVGGGDERIRVTQRYEDTNRLLGSLVLSRRRTVPVVDSI